MQNDLDQDRQWQNLFEQHHRDHPSDGRPPCLSAGVPDQLPTQAKDDNDGDSYGVAPQVVYWSFILGALLVIIWGMMTGRI